MKKAAFTFFVMCAVAILAQGASGDTAKKDIALQRSGSDKSLLGPTESFINFSDNFESYSVGGQLVVQNPTDWETWSGPSGTTEDPYVSDVHAFSGTNSVVIVQNNDLVKTFGSLTSGMWKMSWQNYIPTGKSGYFNTLADFNTGSPWNWAMEAYFNTDGTGDFYGGSVTPTAFSYTQGAWFTTIVICDLDNDLGTFILDGDTVATWQWTLGAYGGGSPLELDANDLYGYLITNEMYHDDYEIVPLACQDFTNFLARCTASGMVQARVVLMGNIEHSGETVLFDIDETIYPSTIGDNGTSSRASISISGLGAGDHTITLIDPTDCFDPIVVTCLVAKEGVNREWEADDARWAAEASQANAQVAPAATKLLGSYPNPFNPVTTISYQLSTDAHVTLTVSDVIGREVARLVNGPQEAGDKSILFDGSNLASGIYFYRLQARPLDHALSGGDFVETKRLILIK